ncbi:fumarylacetoacetase [Pseudosulfitobacter pseudonitzschiae]|uniref:fumarylacetoacetase n=1 Tax=Pseudosulfitobacter pseudonitzschiae TaxID=1402135 RepID=UPI001AF52059|nr:fumarylacetoacetase [Pseudosulfitobacter pseudonitzschiae]MBM1816547.1 fumarylacetoacetase [Pseudosulfitobacter pseudonitzschiae]MBM1833145.1 fumarylacetoacetase [Pseudosulfitobacter pseudonitzschiae]MBM1838013.1 fumarylacetoacetase [Pseudosulfitobacter pseudonitzschiae]MBM1843274.1 fumarylacetoacetase [Pseudosulfitobacter pseudonitzschiae]MBM1848140.1 fumarylacetoacetase [Pseudosulfitobacter pseudonitzschiae]
MPLMKSWITSANSADTDFPLNNLPYGVFSVGDDDPRCGVAIGDMILDLAAAEDARLVTLTEYPLFDVPFWNEVMEEGPAVWAALRARLMQLLSEGSADQDKVAPLLVPMADATMHLPMVVAEYTDFYAGRHHATNVGTMFRGAENALPPNWLHIPIGYNGRASSVVVSGTDIRRPWGQLKGPNDDKPRFAPCARFDIELEMGAIVGTPSDRPLTVDEADAAIFGYVLLNDWSARDIQAWEYQPLGPFQAKATATTISPWIVTKAALEPFRTDTPAREFELLDHLKDTGPMLYNIDLSVTLAPAGKDASVIARTNYNEMYYSSAQQLAHHTTAGSPMTPGDLLGSGTISGAEKSERGSLLELSWGGKEPFTLDTGETRSFIEDGDTLGLHGHASGDGYRIGFGPCIGTVLPALDDPYKR